MATYAAAVVREKTADLKQHDWGRDVSAIKTCALTNPTYDLGNVDFSLFANIQALRAATQGELHVVFSSSSRVLRMLLASHRAVIASSGGQNKEDS